MHFSIPVDIYTIHAWGVVDRFFHCLNSNDIQCLYFITDDKVYR